MTTIKVPAGVDWAAVVKHVYDNHGIEIAGGLGPTVGKARPSLREVAQHRQRAAGHPPLAATGGRVPLLPPCP